MHEREAALGASGGPTSRAWRSTKKTPCLALQRPHKQQNQAPSGSQSAASIPFSYSRNRPGVASSEMLISEDIVRSQKELLSARHPASKQPKAMMQRQPAGSQLQCQQYNFEEIKEEPEEATFRRPSANGGT